MTLILTREDWTAIFPRAPVAIIDAFVADVGRLDAVGITASRARLAYALANVEHECAGFTIKDLTESTRYTAKRMAEVWPNRFADEGAVKAKYGTAPGWQKKAFDDIYGNRMGNRPGTDDGSRYIGRGGPQITGRDGYLQVGRRTGLKLVEDPELATRPEHQPAILAAFVDWKKLNPLADAGKFTDYVVKWNGGTNGLADRRAQMAGNQPIISRLTLLAAAIPRLELVV